MSYFDTKQALLTILLNASITGVTKDDIAYENKFFDPKGKTLWLAAYFIPASSDTMGKTIASSDEQRGIFQVSVFVKLNAGEDYDNTQLQAIDEVLAAFVWGRSETYNGQQVDILESAVNNGIESDGWFKRDISINYLTFSSRT